MNTVTKLTFLIIALLLFATQAEAGGGKKEWHFENKEFPEATKKIFKEENIQGIDLIHSPISKTK